MNTKTFGNKKITIRKISKSDLKNVKKFQNFINSLIEEGAMIKRNKKLTLKEETEWLKGVLKQMEKKTVIHLIAEHQGEIIGSTGSALDRGRQSHVGDFGITIRKGYRRIGLGTYLGREVIKLAKKELRPAPKLIRLSVYSLNKPAIKLYKKLGFKKVARIPKQAKVGGKLVDEIIMIL